MWVTQSGNAIHNKTKINKYGSTVMEENNFFLVQPAGTTDKSARLNNNNKPLGKRD